MSNRRPLKYSILLRLILFILALCTVLSVVNFFSFRNALYKRYEAYITDLLHYAALNIDVEDLKECLATGEKSEQFMETQEFFDTIKDGYNIDYIYVIIPQNTSDYDNIRNVIAGMSSYEKAYAPDMEVQLGGLTGSDYTAETATKYYNAMDTGDQIVFFAEWADRFGIEYTGILSLYDTEGNFFAELCVDVALQDIQNTVQLHVLITVLITTAIGVFFTILFLIWTRNVITNPLQEIEKKVGDLANRSHSETDPNSLVLEIDNIHTDNELQTLSEAIVKLSHDLRDYLLKCLSAQSEAESAQKKALQMSEQASRDALTGIRNRHAYEAEVQKIEWRIRQEDFTKFGIAMVDLNFLKRINDTFGHEKGNCAIIKICTIVCRVFSHSPVFRIGGDEFVVILENDDFEAVDERMSTFDGILKKLREDTTLDPWEKVSAAIGWSSFDPDIDQNVDNVFKRADQKMYENKKKMKAIRVV